MVSELYQLPNGWEWKKLDDITELITKGTTPTTNGYKFQNSGINFLKIENIVNGEIDLSTIEMFISEEAHKSQKRSQLEENDVLFSIAGTIGDTAIVKKEHLPMNTNQAIALIRPKEILNSFFLKYSLVSIISQNTKDKQRGGAIKNISLGDIKDLMYPLPPLEEQKRIVSKLDKLFEKIDKSIALHQKNMDEADVFMGSVLNDVFGELEEKYGADSIGNIATVLNGRAYKKEELLNNGKYRVLRVGNFFTNENWFYSDLELEDNKYCDNGDLLYAWSASFGPKIWMGEKVIFHYHIWKILPSNKITKEYLYHYLDFDVSKIKSELGTGTTMIHITKGSMENRIIPLPPLSIQQKVVKYLDEISEKMEILKRVQNDKMAHLKALKASILDSAFRGEL